MSQQDSAIEVKVGALILFALVLLGGFTWLLGDFSFSQGQTYKVIFRNAAGLKPGADVSVAGLDVGQVERLRFTEETSSDGPAIGAEVTIRVRSAHTDRLTTDSKFYISTQGVLGEPYIEIETPTEEADPLSDGTTVYGISPPRTDMLASEALDLIETINGLLRDSTDEGEKLLGLVGDVLEHLDAFMDNNRETMASTVEGADKSVDRAAKLLAALNVAVGDGKTLRATLSDARATMGRTRSISREVDGDLAPLLDDVSATAEHARSTGETADQLLNDNKSKIDDSIANVHASTKKLDNLSTDAEKVVADIESGEGTVGQLLQDRKIYDDLREILRIVKRQPWRIIWKE